jgi:hypothetical protein
MLIKLDLVDAFEQARRGWRRSPFCVSRCY